MPKITKILGVGAVLACLAGAGFAETEAKDLGPDTVVATVNGTDITLGMMVAVRNALPAEYKQLPDELLFDGVLDQLIQQTALAEIGEGMMTHRDEITLEVDRRAYLAGMLLDYTARRAVTPETLQEAYDAKYAAAEPTREFHAAHIIVPTKEEAEAILADIQGGADFAEVAKEKSQDGAAANGGDLGWFGLEQMVQPFAEAVASMKDGDVKGPVQTEYGWHVVKLLESRLGTAPTLEEASDDLAGDLRQKAVEDRVNDTIAKATVEKHIEGIDPAVLKDPKLTGEE
ncbi:peptidyl-prolyl cis-trans isomerase C [Rhodobacter sp. JA431]|uniref:peptidylprolyl isomerase n=1 Tax=Rhodobacter sp. JA431 TaxID=570013 RepID=UPI000BDDC279|nr:peptidylprolyl isomerase [Rhodobacter sp. JA431]SOC19161.1 peptidyl-prolyl cis-trans isomerase C [Rhodobacter sp. JA431]